MLFVIHALECIALGWGNGRAAMMLYWCCFTVKT